MKKIVSTFLVLCLLLCTVSVCATAVDDGSRENTAIRLTAEKLDDIKEKNLYVGNYVYLGVEKETPIKWRVLDSKANNGEDGLFIVAENTYKNNSTNFGASESFLYNKSKLAKTTKAFATQCMSDVELDALIATYKTDEAYKFSNPIVAGGDLQFETKRFEDILKGDKLFALSYEEINNKNYFPNTKSINIAGKYLLRTTFFQGGGYYSDDLKILRPAYNGSYLYANSYSNVFTTYDTGLSKNSIVITSEDKATAIRPAGNLDIKSILFTSQASGGKAENGINKIKNNADVSEWKCTLLDKTRDFHAAVTSNVVTPGENLAVFYSGATLGENEYLSVIITDSDDTPVYYGRFAQPEVESGFADMQLPKDLEGGNYTLSIFNEKYNGGEDDTNCISDISSAFSKVAITVDGTATAKTIDSDTLYYGSHTNSGDIEWRVISQNAEKVTLLSERVLDNVPYHMSNTYATYEGSTLRSWLNAYDSSANYLNMSYKDNGFLKTSFSSAENGVMTETKIGENVSDKVYVLSENEAEEYLGSNKELAATNTDDENASWWLRSDKQSQTAPIVSPGNWFFGTTTEISAENVGSTDIGVRPAITLDMRKTAFVSEADGKNADDDGDTIADFDVSRKSPCKLTVFDSTKASFTADAGITQDNLLIVNYSGASVGENEYLSIIVKNKDGEITHYDRLLQLDGTQNKASGEYEKTISTEIPDDSTIYVFNETYNGDFKTDYVSALFQTYTVGGESEENTASAEKFGTLEIILIVVACVVVGALVTAAAVIIIKKRKKTAE